jgi:lysophospholipase L1-like esterase
VSKAYIAFLSLMLASLFVWRVGAEPIPLVIVALGDSTTAGTPFFLSPLESPPDGQGDPQGQYSYWMMKKHPDWKVINCGINGQTTQEIGARIDDTFRYHARYIIILGGVNDVYQGIPLSETVAHLTRMYQQAKTHGMIPIAATVLPFNTASPQQSKGIRTLNAWILKNADDMRIEAVDLHAVVCDPSNSEKLNGSSDGLHPDVGGYRKMGLTLTALIEKMETLMPH